MANQAEQAQLFTGLHVKGNPLVIFNIWDAGTAKALTEVGAKAVATGSWAVAEANGFADGENVPLDFVIENLRRIVNAVDLPVSLDFEGGYAVRPDVLRKNIERVIDAGAVGINFEDRKVPGRDLFSIEEQCERIRALRNAADDKGISFYINARSDVVLPLSANEHTQSHLEELIDRAQAYAEAGARGFFAPGLVNPDFIGKLCEASPLPVNILVVAGVPSLKKLAGLGVARISYGGGTYRMTMAAFKDAAQKALTATSAL
ncbi:MAG TPA: isocitrate lyase/phosphoenolpyruvate mutase family protein [Pyrinomonadaceae bacterium]|nr:isocitrate lyase/phosphoenolpyruvate mutase family protein [Pyrinomonadaceae bacterium]